MKGRQPQVDEHAVFLNVPYDPRYEPLFIAIFAAVLALGRMPRCVLELSDGGEGRLSRLLRLIGGCRTSFHDLSREGYPARHNMPFEFGMAYARREYYGNHDCFILERHEYRSKRTLSDVGMFETHAHHNGPYNLIACVLDALGTNPMPDLREVHQLYQLLGPIAKEVKRRHGRRTLYYRAAYIEFRNAAILTADKLGFYAGRHRSAS